MMRSALRQALNRSSAAAPSQMAARTNIAPGALLRQPARVAAPAAEEQAQANIAPLVLIGWWTAMLSMKYFRASEEEEKEDLERGSSYVKRFRAAKKENERASQVTGGLRRQDSWKERESTYFMDRVNSKTSLRDDMKSVGDLRREMADELVEAGVHHYHQLPTAAPAEVCGDKGDAFKRTKSITAVQGISRAYM